jgi:predicted Zn-dependent protease
MKIPDIAENGAVVPVTVSTDLENVESISVIVINNPTPLAATFDLGPRSQPKISVRIKMGESSIVRAVVKSGGKLYSTEKEVRIGEKAALKIAESEKIVIDVDVNEQAERILDRIVAVCDRKDIVYFIKIIDEDMVNAVSLPGGYIFLFRGIIDKAESEDEIASVIAHEVAHITARHGVKRMQKAYASMALQIASVQAGGRMGQGVSLALSSLFMEYSQEDEFESDQLSVKYLKKAGYDPKAMVTFLEKLRAERDRAPLHNHSYWKTHPNIDQRIAVSNQAVTGKLEFQDYLDLTGNEENDWKR